MNCKRLFFMLPFVLMSCREQDVRPVNNFSYNDKVQNRDQKVIEQSEFVPIYPRITPRTFENTEKFNLETPLRCEVDWSDQNLISTQPYGRSDFYLERIDKGDELPDLNVKNFSFKKTPINEALSLLLKNTGISVKKSYEFFPELTQDVVGGNLYHVIEFLTNVANVYYHYDNRTKMITLSKIAKWNLHVPLSKEVILGVEDALRGVNIDDITIDWQDKVIIFSGDFVTEKRVRKIMNKFAVEDFLIAYDIDIYRSYPKNAENTIKWMNVIPAFNKDTVKYSKKGVIGRALVVSSNFNTDALKDFLYKNTNTLLISSGTFIVPNRWQGRFDIGRCSRENHYETDLDIITKTNFKTDDKYVGRLDSMFALKTAYGDVASYNLPSRLGENIVIIGIPTQVLIDDKTTTIPPNTELIVFISPRIIQIVRNQK